VGADGLLGWVDVDRLGEFGWLWWPGDEAFGMSGECGGQGRFALAVDLIGGAEVDRRRRVVSDAGVTVLEGVPIEEIHAEGSGVIDPGEAGRELWPILHRAELGFGERVVVRRPRPGDRSGDLERGEQLRDRLGGWDTTVGMDRQLLRVKILAVHGLVDEAPGELRVLDAASIQPGT